MRAPSTCHGGGGGLDRSQLTRWAAAAALGAALALFLVLGESQVRAEAQPPHTITGFVFVGADAERKPDLRVEARIANINYANSVDIGRDTLTESNGQFGAVNNFHVCADDPETDDKEGGTTGDQIEFFVENIKANLLLFDGSEAGSLSFELGGNTEISLFVPSLDISPTHPLSSESSCVVTVPFPTPEPTPTPTATPLGFSPIIGGAPRPPAPATPTVGPQEVPTEELIATTTPEVLPTAEELNQLFPDTAAALLSDANATTTAGLLEDIDTFLAAGVLEVLDPEQAAAVFVELMPDSALLIIQEMQPAEAAELLVLLGIQTTVEVIGAIDSIQAASILESMDTQYAADVLAALSTQQAAAILAEVGPIQAAAIVVNLGTQEAATLLPAMPPIDTAEIV